MSSIQRAAPANDLLARLLFLILPTALVAWFLLYQANVYYAILQDGFWMQAAAFAGSLGDRAGRLLGNSSWVQALYFAAGMGLSALFHAFRFRFLLPFLGLLALFWAARLGIDQLAIGEFDSFFLNVQFRVFTLLFTIGWVVGWGFMRVRRFAIIVAALLLSASILVIAKMQSSTVENLLRAFVPVALYAVYIIFAAEQIFSYDDKSRRFWLFLGGRLLGFGVLVALVMGSVLYFMRGEIKETVAAFGGGGKGGSNSMLKKDKNGNFDLKDYSRLQSSLGRDNELLFCAHINNFFDGTDEPNPLYLTAFYYTKFDTATETFERDTAALPANDLFEPNPGAIPLFATAQDKSVVERSGTKKGAREVETEIYLSKLSPSTYLAPHTGYFVQPITVEKDFRDSFRFAYRAKSVVSELNSAYFVYNAKDPQIQAFQKQRFEILRGVTGFSGEDTGFMRYYTYMPRDAKFDRIRTLAQEVTAKAKTPVDKVIAIRDWFLSKDAAGQPLFKYTDNPGVPGLPSASKLQYFLFENHKGYCAYFAGGTLFMLRALGIPSRIAVGFLTVDRSGGKNKGWYWYYADQAHAWVQVYFPGYGWLDFDTTVGNDEAQEAPRTDGTPPMQPPRAWFAAEGVLSAVDTAKKTGVLQVNRFVFHDKEYRVSLPTAVSMDLHIAEVFRDSVQVPLANAKPGDTATAVSYAEAFKNMGPGGNAQAEVLLSRLPTPAPIDEVYLRRAILKKEKDQQPVVAQEKPFSWRNALWMVAGIAALLVLFLFALPSLVMAYYNLRRKNAQGANQAYWTWRAAAYRLHMAGYTRIGRTPLQYAGDVDARFGTSLARLVNLHLKSKYSGTALSAPEMQTVRGFYGPFVAAVRRQVPARARVGGWLNPVRMGAFFLPGGDRS